MYRYIVQNTNLKKIIFQIKTNADRIVNKLIPNFIVLSVKLEPQIS